MEFGLTADQKMMQESVDRTLERVCAAGARAQGATRTTSRMRADVLRGAGELGVPGILIPEEFGGLGLALLDAALAAEMLGRHVAPVPFVASAVMAPLALIGAGSEAQKTAWLPKLARGEIDRRRRGQRTRRRRAREGAASRRRTASSPARRCSCSTSRGADIFIVADKFGGSASGRCARRRGWRRRCSPPSTRRAPSAN